MSTESGTDARNPSKNRQVAVFWYPPIPNGVQGVAASSRGIWLLVTPYTTPGAELFRYVRAWRLRWPLRGRLLPCNEVPQSGGRNAAGGGPARRGVGAFSGGEAEPSTGNLNHPEVSLCPKPGRGQADISTDIAPERAPPHKQRDLCEAFGPRGRIFVASSVARAGKLQTVIPQLELYHQ